MFRAALLILSGNSVAWALMFARNLIVARLVSVEDYGIAATLAIVMSLVEMLSALGLQQQIVQARDGDDPRLQAGLQGFQVLRGALAAVILFALAHPIAAFLNLAHVAWAYQVMALVPFLNACVHFDVYRLNRRMRFLPGILTLAVPAALSVLALWPLAAIWGDYRVMLYALLVQAGMTALTSHLVAERPYRLSFDRAIMAQGLAFGWPILVNGAMLFAIFNGERLIVGRELGIIELAYFSMAFTLTLTPTLLMESSARNFFLPQLSAARDDGRPEEGRPQEGRPGARFAHLAMTACQAHVLFAGLLIAGTVLFGPAVVHLLLGPKYEPVIPILTWLAVLQGVRVMKGGPSTAALACGQTGNATMGNILRVALLPLAWGVAARTGDVVAVIWLGILGEVAGVVVSYALLRWRVGLGLAAMGLPLLCGAVLSGLAGLHAWGQDHPGAAVPDPVWTMSAAAAVLALALVAMADLRRYAARREFVRHDG